MRTDKGICRGKGSKDEDAERKRARMGSRDMKYVGILASRELRTVTMDAEMW